MNKIANQKIKLFLEGLSSSSATPGGGAVAALSGALAASLVEMVANLTKGKILNVKKTTKIRKEFLKLADEDCNAFDSVMKAYKLKSKPEIKKALVKAIKVPQRVIKLSQEIERLSQVAIKKGNKNAASDAKSALHLIRAAKSMAIENVKINKVLLKRIGA